jgi:serine/threonine protein kinase HipA of HipAB toxin-antitoxin module
VRTLREIRQELDRAVERRTRLWEELGAGHDAQKSAEAARLSERINELWAEARRTAARERFGPSEAIIGRARVEERLEREEQRRLNRAA